MRNHSHRLIGGNGNFIIFAEATGMIDPGEGVFHHPSPRELFPLMRLDFLWNINVKINPILQIRNESTPAIQRPHRAAEQMNAAHMLVWRQIFRLLFHEYWQHEPQTDNKHPSTSTTMCRFLPFIFSLRQFCVLRWLLPFSHSGNQWSRSLDSPCVRHLFASFLQDAPEFYPTAHWSGRGDKSCVLLNTAENHGVTASIYTLHPESTKYSTASVNSRLLHVQLRIPVYNGAISSHCSSVKSLGYDSRSFLSMYPILPLFYPLVNTGS